MATVLLFFSVTIIAQTKPQRVVAIGGSISEIICALGHEADLTAVDISSIYPDSLAKLPQIGYWLHLSQEGILSLKPSLVVASEYSKPKEVLLGLKKFGVKTYLIDDKPTIESVEKKILQIGKIFHEEKKAQAMVQRMKTNTAKVKRETKENSSQNNKVLFIFYRSDSKIMAAGKDTPANTLIRLSGTQNAVNFDNYKILSQEAMVKINPDVIIVGDLPGNRFNAKDMQNKAMQITAAYKNKRIYNMDMLLVSGFGARFDKALMEFSCKVNNNKLSYCS